MVAVSHVFKVFLRVGVSKLTHKFGILLELFSGCQTTTAQEQPQKFHSSTMLGHDNAPTSFTVFTVVMVVSFANMCDAHPNMLDCGALGTSIRSNTPIMASVPKKVSESEASFLLTAVGKFAGGFTNYSFVMTSALGAVIQAEGNSTVLANYGDGICGNDPKHPGSGLCVKCKSGLFAAQYDCNQDKCVFGVAGDGKSKVTLLIGTSAGSTVDYTPVTVDA